MPFPPTPSNTATITPTPSITATITPSITPSGEPCFPFTPSATPTNTLTPTNTPTITPTATSGAAIPDIYITVCCNPINDGGGCNYVVAYADYTPNAFGSNPAIIQDDISIVGDLTDTTYDQTTVYLDMFSGESKNCGIVCYLGPDGVVTDYTLYNISPSSSTTANYIISSTSITGNCATCESCSQVTFERVGTQDALFEFMDCSGVTHTFNGVEGWSATYCGVLDTAMVLSGSGFIQYFDTCTDPEAVNPVTVSLGYDPSDAPTACSATPTDYYLIAGNTLTIGTTIYYDYSVDSTFIVPDGFYSDGTNVYEVSGGVGQIGAISSC